MDKTDHKRFDTTNALVALGVLAVTLFVYLLTKAPTLSFWDCGEFIAAAYTLGVPHPPGSPLYIIVARIFSIIPLFADIAVRVNFMSSLCNAVAAMFGYLALVRILRLWYKADKTAFTRFLIYAGSVCGALFMAFGRTQWTNSVETEVYGMTMLLFTAGLWLTLIYYENQGTRLADRVLLLIAYLAILGIGVHLTAFLILPVSALFFLLAKDTPVKIWFAVGAFFVIELFLILALSSRPGELPYYVPVIIVLIFYAFYIFSFDTIPGRALLVALGFLLACSPVLLLLWTNTGGAGGGAIGSVLPMVGVVSLVGLVLYGVYALFGQWKLIRARKEADRNTVVTSLMILAAGLMSLILVSPIKGYYAFLVMSLLLTIGLVAITWRYLRWPMLIAVFALALVIIGVKPFVIGLLVAAVAIPVVGKSFRLPGWRTALLVLLVAVSGYSVHLFLPIRSSQRPIINQNNPSEGIETTIRYMERQQYGSQGMVERMFVRRAEWGSQFGNYQRMGFWRFFDEQFGMSGPRFFILFVLGLFGLWEVVRKRPRIGIHLIILLLIASVGLILYMNFADGQRQDAYGRGYIEVRDRDYFFTPAFVLFGLSLGLGVTMLVQFVRDSSRSLPGGARNLITGGACALFLLPAVALAGNYGVCDRSRNFVPYDYAKSLLESCDENAMLLAGGDNDTFPLWCLQEVYGVRRDVKVVCLPLANTHWYIKQIRDDLGLELGWTDDEIKKLRSFRAQDGRTFRIQDQVVDELLDLNWPERPLNIGVVVGKGSRKYHGLPMDSMLEQSGLVFRMLDTKGGFRVDIEKSIELFTDPSKFLYRGLADTTVHKDAATTRAMRNMANSFLIVIDSLMGAGEYDRVVELSRFMLDKLPGNNDALKLQAGALLELGKLDELRALIDSTTRGDTNRLRVYLARGLRRLDKPSEAEVILRSVLLQDNRNRPAFQELTRLYVAAQQYRALEQLFIAWVRVVPDDEQVEKMLRDLQARMAAGPASGE